MTMGHLTDEIFEGSSKQFPSLSVEHVRHLCSTRPK